MSKPLRVRRSLRELEQIENKPALDKLIRAFLGIQQLPPSDPNSFFVIAGYHGEPFAATGKGISWGGYCFHNAVLFPTWHRAYCLRIENALRSIEGCEDVTLPYWDELAEEGSELPVPKILTSPTYTFQNETEPIHNPLYSYKLQQSLVGEGLSHRYSKGEGYATTRFPLSGLVGTEKARKDTKVWNEKWKTPDDQATQLNWNIRNWLLGKVDIDRDAGAKGIADTYSTIARLRKCIKAPNYTVFSNKASAAEYATNNKHDNPTEHWVVALEEPHNAMHLALGGMFQKATKLPKSDGYNADPRDYEGANGDMGCNETAAFDPIFFIHHCFIDYTFWSWQKKHGKTAKGSLEIDHTIKAGTSMVGGNAAIPAGTKLETTSPLKPFHKPNSDRYYNSNDVTNIEELGYTYSEGSWDALFNTVESAEAAEDSTLVAVWKTATVDRSEFSGSFVIRTYAEIDGKKVEIGRDPILSRYDVSNCENCQSTLKASAVVAVDEALAEVLDPDNTRKIAYTVEIQHLEGQDVYNPGGHKGFMAVEPNYIEY